MHNHSSISDYFRSNYKPCNSTTDGNDPVSLFSTAATPASQRGSLTLTSEPPEDPSVLKTENNESHHKEPSPTRGAEQSISQDVAQELVIRSVFRSISLGLFIH